MEYEKSFDSPKKVYEDALLSVKKQKASNDAAIAARSAEIARVRETLVNSISTQQSAFEAKIVECVSRSFEHCLRSSLTLEQVNELMPKMKDGLSAKHFILTQPQIQLAYLLQAEVDEIWNELCGKMPTVPNVYIEKYHSSLKDKFDFYEVSLKNAQAAIDLDKQVAADNLAKIAAQQKDAEIAAKLEAVSVPHVIDETPQGKALKQVYALDMEESEASAIAIITAFSVNWKAASQKVRVKKWFNLSVSQMADCLVALKNDDEKFSVTGINFKLVEKL